MGDVVFMKNNASYEAENKVKRNIWSFLKDFYFFVKALRTSQICLILEFTSQNEWPALYQYNMNQQNALFIINLF